MIKFIITIIAIMGLCLNCLEGRERNTNMAVGIGYPYIAVKYKPVEFKFATGEGINVYAGRLYLTVLDRGNLKCFSGLEFGIVDFNTLDTLGNGYEGGVLLGGELFFTKRLSFMLDFTPTYIGLTSEGVGIEGIEFIVNTAVYFYFF